MTKSRLDEGVGEKKPMKKPWKGLFSSRIAQRKSQMLPFCRREPPKMSPKRKRCSVCVAEMLLICPTNVPYLSHHPPNMSPQSRQRSWTSISYAPLQYLDNYIDKQKIINLYENLHFIILRYSWLSIYISTYINI